MEFKGKVALVTGAGTGNGEAIAARLHAGGACVALVSRRLEQVESVSRSIDPEGARTVALEADVRDPKAMEGAVWRTLERFAKLDLAVNNAGITGPAGVPVQDLEAEIWREVIDTDRHLLFHEVRDTRNACQRFRRDSEHVVRKRPCRPGGHGLIHRGETRSHRVDSLGRPGAGGVEYPGMCGRAGLRGNPAHNGFRQRSHGLDGGPASHEAARHQGRSCRSGRIFIK